MRCVPIGTHLLLTCGISEERKFQTNVKDFKKMVIFDTVSMLFWGCFFMLRRGFAFAPQSTRLRDHKSTSATAEATITLRSLRDHKSTSL